MLGKSDLPSRADFVIAESVSELSRSANWRIDIKNYTLNLMEYEDLLISMDVTTQGGLLMYHKVDAAKTIANSDGDLHKA